MVDEQCEVQKNSPPPVAAICVGESSQQADAQATLAAFM